MANGTILVYLIRFLKEDTGLTMIEYALIAALVSIVVVGILSNTGTILSDWFFSISGELVAAGTGI